LKRFVAFLFIGSCFATVEEFLTIVVLKHDMGGYLFTLLVLFPIFLTLVFLSSRLINRFIHWEPAQDITYFFVYGFAGLAIEWFLIGLSPWSNPGANPILMFILQLGIFSFWSTVSFAPRLFLNKSDLNLKIRRSILRFFIPYFVVVYLVCIAAPEKLKFITIIPLVIFGYLFLNIFYVKYFRERYLTSPTQDA